MSKIVKFVTLIFLLSSCATQKVFVKHNKLNIPKLEVKIDEIVLEEVDVTKNDKKGFYSFINNIHLIRLRYNELLLKYKNDVEYYNAVIDSINDTK